MKNKSWKDLNWYFPKDAHQKSEGGGLVRFSLKKLDSFTLETSKNHLIRNFLRNGRVMVNDQKINLVLLRDFLNSEINKQIQKTRTFS